MPAPSLTVTVPVGVPPPDVAVTEYVVVTTWPVTAGFGADASAVSVAARFTT